MNNTNNNRFKQCLTAAKNAVEGLSAMGLMVESLSMGNHHPVIEIARPPARITPKGAEVICIRGRGGLREEIKAATYRGCLVKWKA